MRWSKFFIPTAKETPSDAVVASHRLMIRAGLIRQVAAGAYAHLPLGHRVMRKVEQIVREEMDRAGAIEMHMPALRPIEPREESSRGAVLELSYEECVTEIVRSYVTSYKQLPVMLYQIRSRSRDDERPRGGVLRAREFAAMDAYSFDADHAGTEASYHKMYDACSRICLRCGLPYVVVEADSGVIDGDASHEFMVPTDTGDEMMVRDEGHAASIERATCAPLPQDESPMAPTQEVHTPSQRTIDEVCAFLGTKPQQMIKTLVFTATMTKAHAGAPVSRTVVALVRGDHEINDSKLRRAVGAAEVELAEAGVIEKLTGANVGFAGPQGLLDRDASFQMVVDQAVSVLRNAATGANRTDYHVCNVNPGRDFPLAGDRVKVADIRNVTPGDCCPRSGRPLEFVKAIAVGRVSALGTKYTGAMKAEYVDVQGKGHAMVMDGCAIRLNHVVAAAIEAHNDENGIIWPMAIAPYHVLICALDAVDAEVSAAASRLHDDLTAKGLDVLLDDRDIRPGPKFKDADLTGIPIRVTIGKKGLKDGVVEVKNRDGAEVIRLAPEEAVDEVVRRYRAAVSI